MRFTHRLSLLFLTLASTLIWVLPSPSLARPPDSPRDSGFTPLEWVENVASCNYPEYPIPGHLPEDYHPLRPYPASPCDPLIPRKDPEAPDDPDQNYLTFSCGKSMNPSGTMTFVDVVNVDILPPLPGSPALNTQYRCSPGADEVCVLKHVTFDVNLDLSPAKFPILGNTQDPTLTDNTKVNHYLNWYLNGTVQQSEDWRPLTVAEIDRLINYSGPVKKLLSRDSQFALKNTLKAGPLLEEQYHNYLVVEGTIPLTNQRLDDIGAFDPASTWALVPLSSNEDITSEVTIGLIPGQQPTDNDGDVVGSSMTLTIGSGADSRLYFPHLRSANALSDLLTGSFRPQLPTPTPGVSTEDDEFVAQVIPEHQGLDDSTVVLRFDSLTGQNTRNTEVIPGAAAPDPLYIPPDQRCEITNTRTNTGDDLVGSSIPATLAYDQLFRYTPQVAHFPPGCIEEHRSCGVGDTCCYGGDCDVDRPYCDGPCDAFVCCEVYRNRPSCEAQSRLGCNWEVPRGTCPAYPTVELDTSARIATFVKTPTIERLYDNLVVGSQSLLRRFLPQKPASVSEEYITGEDDIDNTIPSYGDVTTSVSSSIVNSPGISAGNGSGSPQIYFPRTGSLFDHLMGGTLATNANLQRALRPYKDLQIPTASDNGEINCVPRPPQTSDCVDKANYIHIAEVWHWAGGHPYAEQCWDDTIYRANAAGVNRDLALLIWVNESDTSNYEAIGELSDFGMVFSPHNNYSAQIDAFLGHANMIASQCAGAIQTYGPARVFAARFKSGSCIPYPGSENYAESISLHWSWIGGSCPFPFP